MGHSTREELIAKIEKELAVLPPVINNTNSVAATAESVDGSEGSGMSENVNFIPPVRLVSHQSILLYGYCIREADEQIMAIYNEFQIYRPIRLSKPAGLLTALAWFELDIFGLLDVPYFKEQYDRLPQIGTKWRHSNGISYKVVGNCFDVKSGQLCVLYTSVVDPLPIPWSRPLVSWEERINEDRNRFIIDTQ
jgi:hypothetical protein